MVEAVVAMVVMVRVLIVSFAVAVWALGVRVVGLIVPPRHVDSRTET
jgi:hypothetical protein